MKISSSEESYDADVKNEDIRSKMKNEKSNIIERLFFSEELLTFQC